MRILYLTHYSVMEPLGQSQILPYLIGLAALGYSIEIVSFEKSTFLNDQQRFQTQDEVLRNAGIRWFPRVYRPGSSIRNILVDLVTTAAEISRQCRSRRMDLIHCRVHVPFLMAWYASARQRIPILFDFRGFLAEEYVDAGLWKPKSAKYYLTKLLERGMTSWCSAMIVLTAAARDYFLDTCHVPPEKLFVIPCCVDLELFRAPNIPIHPLPGRSLKVVYSGSTDGRYNLPEMIRFFAVLRSKRPGSHFTILTTGDQGTLKKHIRDSSLPEDAVSLVSLPHCEVPKLLSQQDLGLLFYRGGRALLATSPTKLGEYLACGLAVVAEKGLGGLEEVLVGEGVGCLTRSDQPTTWEAAASRVIQLCDQDDIRQKAIRTAAKYYSLPNAVRTYVQAYEFCASRHC